MMFSFGEKAKYIPELMNDNPNIQRLFQKLITTYIFLGKCSPFSFCVVTA